MNSISIEQFTVFQKEPESQAIAKDFIAKSLKKIWGKLPLVLSHPHLFPLVWSQCDESDGSQINLFCLGPFQNRFFKYFYEYCLRLCEPDIVDPISLFAIDFMIHFKETNQRLTLCQVCIDLPSPNLIPRLEKKLHQSTSYLKQGPLVLLFDNPTDLEKEPLEEEHRTRLYDLLSRANNKVPESFKPFITTKLQQLLASSPRLFLYERGPRHLVNLAVQLAHMQSKAQGSEKTAKRRAWVHHTSRWIHGLKRPQKIECWVITLNFLKANEVLEERHFLQIFKRLASSLQRIHFFTTFRDPENKLIHFYAEVLSDVFEKNNLKRLPSLESWISREIVNKVERKPLAVFTARNEEESLKWLTTLSKEISSKTDIPQIALIFHNQTDEKLVFHLLIARVLLPSTPSLQNLLSHEVFEHEISYHFDKIKKIESPHLTKELCLIEIEISKSPFLREDFCVNIQKARLWLLRSLQSILGPLRDYNGGLVAKQQEMFEIIEQEIRSGPLSSSLTVFEDFFFNLQPAPMISSFEPLLLLDWMSSLIQKNIQNHQPKQVQRILFDSKNQDTQATGIWFVGISDTNLEKIRQRINDSLRYEHEIIWTQKRKTIPLIIGCLIKTKADTHKTIQQLLLQLLPKSTVSKKNKTISSE